MALVNPEHSADHITKATVEFQSGMTIVLEFVLGTALLQFNAKDYILSSDYFNHTASLESSPSIELQGRVQEVIKKGVSNGP